MTTPPIIIKIVFEQSDHAEIVAWLESQEEKGWKLISPQNDGQTLFPVYNATGISEKAMIYLQRG